MIGRKSWTFLLFGLLCGLIASTSLVYAWNRPFASGSALYLLGSGKGLSALVTTNGIRVIVASGNDPIAFANALADARPLTSPRVDLLIITPGSIRVANRAREITNPAMVLEIAAANMEHQVDAEHLVLSREEIALGDEIRLVIDPGNAIGSPITGWSITLEQGHSQLLLVETLPVRQVSKVALISVMGDEFDAPRVSPAQGLAASSLLRDENVAGSYVLGFIDPGESSKIPIGNNAISIPGAWKRD